MMSEHIIKDSAKIIPDFPKEGIHFIDLNPVFRHGGNLWTIVTEIGYELSLAGITKVMGVEARGFILAGALAYKLQAGFVPIRKSGKLPPVTVTSNYTCEYAEGTLEMPQCCLGPEDTVLIYDDVLATGGTAYSALDLALHFNVKKIKLLFLVDIVSIQTRQKNFVYDFDPIILAKF